MSGGRIRSIKPEWLEDEDLASLSDTARMVSVALIVLADDYGNGRAHPLFLASRLWPYSSGDPGATLERLSRALRELLDAGFIELYQVAGQQYFNLRNWSKHQRVDRPSKARIPGPDKADGEPLLLPSVETTGHASGDVGETLAQPSRDTRPGSGSGSGIREVEVDLRAHARETPPPPPNGHQQPAASEADARSVGRDWHRFMQHEVPGNMHGFAQWRADFETVAIALHQSADGVPEHARIARVALCAWFWTASEGPVQGGRIPRGRATPAQLAKHISRDLEAAQAWWSSLDASEQDELLDPQQTPTAQEATP